MILNEYITPHFAWDLKACRLISFLKKYIFYYFFLFKKKIFNKTIISIFY